MFRPKHGGRRRIVNGCTVRRTRTVDCMGSCATGVPTARSSPSAVTGGLSHGAARRVYEDGTTFQTCSYFDRKLHGPRMFFPPVGPTVEPAIPGWDRVDASVTAYRAEYDHCDLIAVRYLDANGREVQADGRRGPRRRRACPRPPRRWPAAGSRCGVARRLRSVTPIGSWSRASTARESQCRPRASPDPTGRDRDRRRCRARQSPRAAAGV